ncbi:MAG TPA: myo-inosose-2 dehydratase [Aliiroseovarius sp.]|nr:myo-inosose-2 dehydratase [Aliiroseovarius sp.]
MIRYAILAPTDQDGLAALGSAGFDGVSADAGQQWPETGALPLAAGLHGLSLCARSLAEEKAALQPTLDRLAAMGTQLCAVAETSNASFADDSAPLANSPVLDEADWPRYGADLEALSEFAARQGITLAYQHRVGTIVETPGEIEKLAQATGPATRLLFDTGQCYFGGGNPAQVLGSLMGRVAHIHIRNLRTMVMGMGMAEGISYPEALRRGVFTQPGDFEGGVELEPVLSIAAVHGYDGWLVLGGEASPTDGLAALKRAVRAVGLDDPR